MLGRWVVCPIEPASQYIILKIVGFLDLFGQRSMHSTLDFCPEQTSQKGIKCTKAKKQLRSVIYTVVHYLIVIKAQAFVLSIALDSDTSIKEHIQNAYPTEQNPNKISKPFQPTKSHEQHQKIKPSKSHKQLERETFQAKTNQLYKGELM